MTAEHKYKLTVTYDGTHYSGWQIQSNGIAIQEIIQGEVQKITQSTTHLIGAGRTDTGVHAKGQVAHFVVKNPLDLFRFKHALNRLLPVDIRVIAVEEVPLEFHARYSATAKVYHYHLHLDPIRDPFVRHYSWHIHHQFDVELLRQGAQFFVGSHDFTSFANDSLRGAASRNAVRTIYSLDVVVEKGGVRLEFKGNGFLYRMVRNITGTLVNVAIGKFQLSDIPRLFEAKDRELAGKGAPAHGLFLMEVEYPNKIIHNMEIK